MKIRVITGEAGSGKSTYIKNNTDDYTVICAPTGVAAANINGSTIFKLFGFHPDNIKTGIIYRFNKLQKQLFDNVSKIIFDEAYMLRPDVLDYVIDKLVYNKVNLKNIQFLFVGDPNQLPPVLTAADSVEFCKNYEFNSIEYSKFFLKNKRYLKREILKDNYRLDLSKESHQVFRKEVLKLIGRLDLTDYFEEKLIGQEEFELLKNQNDTTILAVTRKAVSNYNKEYLEEIKAPLLKSEGLIEGDFPDNLLPVDKTIYYKEGAKIIITKNVESVDNFYRATNINGVEKKVYAKPSYYNGKQGIYRHFNNKHYIEDIYDNYIPIEYVKFENIAYIVEKREESRFNKYLNSFVIEEVEFINKTTLGVFIQLPIIVGAAMTVHKSQGLTLKNKVIVDINGNFEPNSLYVASSRVNNPDNLYYYC